MKKYLFFAFITLILFLAACNESDTPTVEETEGNRSSAEKQAEWKEEQDSEQEPQEIEDGFWEFETNVGKFYMLGMYLNDEINEETGMYEVDFDGFRVDLAIALVDIDVNEEYQYMYDEQESIRAIQITTDVENTNDFDVSYNGNITVITSDGEQLNSDSGILSENPVVQKYYGKVKETGAFTIVMEEDESVPESIELIMDGPYKVEDGAVDPINGAMGEEQRLEFEFISKEGLEE